jgi:hypothetical protein
MPGANDLTDQLAAAQARPRNMERARETALYACSQPELAEVALYEYLDGDGRRVTGPTIVLARELLRSWGNAYTTMIELHRSGNQSVMMTCAWDIEANVWADRRVIVPHVRTTEAGDQPVTDVREITGLLNDVTARRQRRCILDVLPSWYVTQAKNKVWETLTQGDIPFEDRSAALVADFAEYDIDDQQLAEKLDMPFERWSEISLARLRVLYNSLALGALRADEEFPPRRLAGDAISRAEIDPELAAAATPQTAPTEAVTPEPATTEATPPAETDKPRATTRATSKASAQKDKPTTEAGPS